MRYVGPDYTRTASGIYLVATPCRSYVLAGAAPRLQEAYDQVHESLLAGTFPSPLVQGFADEYEADALDFVVSFCCDAGYLETWSALTERAYETRTFARRAAFARRFSPGPSIGAEETGARLAARFPVLREQLIRKYHSEDLVDDALGHASEMLLRRPHLFDESRGCFNTYLYNVAANSCKEQLERAARFVSLDQPQAPPASYYDQLYGDDYLGWLEFRYPLLRESLMDDSLMNPVNHEANKELLALVEHCLGAGQGLDFVDGHGVLLKKGPRPNPTVLGNLYELFESNKELRAEYMEERGLTREEASRVRCQVRGAVHHLLGNSEALAEWRHQEHANLNR